MHDVLVALAFVAMVIFPAFVASFNRPGTDDDL